LPSRGIRGRARLLSPVYHGVNSLPTVRQVTQSYPLPTEDSTRVMGRHKALYGGQAIASADQRVKISSQRSFPQPPSCFFLRQPAPDIRMSPAQQIDTVRVPLIRDPSTMTDVHFSRKTLDDVIHSVIDEITRRGIRIHPTKGPADEITGTLLEISDPRARLSRTETRGRIFSALGELCWYLAASKKSNFISYYIRNYRKLAEDGEIFGGYGPRLLNWKGINQISKVIEILSRNPDSRKAVIQLFDSADLSVEHKDVPCTCTLQFMLRQGELLLFVNTRSNDVHWGLPHDVFCFTMLQEIIARSVSAELGTYKHAVGSLHLYAKDSIAAKRFLKEGWQRTAPVMPPMPAGNPWPSIAVLLEAESAIRNEGTFDEAKLNTVDAYWADLVRLLQVFAAKRHRNVGAIKAVRERMSSEVYFPFIDRAIRQVKALNPLEPPNG
jgi:thymidylate synthase